MSVDDDLMVVRQTLASRKYRDLVVPDSSAWAALARLRLHLGEDPSDSATFDALALAFSRRYSGGESLIVLLSCLAATKAPHPRIKPTEATLPSENEVAATLRVYMKHLKELADRTDDGVLRLDLFAARPVPPEIPLERYEAISHALELIVEQRTSQEHSPGSVQRYVEILALMNDLAEVRQEYGAFLSAVRLVVCALVVNRQQQAGRDIQSGSHVWASEQRAPQLRKQVWMNAADMFQRSNRPIEAALSWLISHDIANVALSGVQIALSLFVSARICRDAHQWDLALGILKPVERLIADGHISSLERARYRSFVASVMFKKLIARSARFRKADLLSAGEEIAQPVLMNLAPPVLQGELLPAALLLAQLIRFVQMNDAEVPQHWSLGMSSTLGRLDASAAERVEEHARKYPTYEYLVKLTVSLSGNKEPAKIGTDAAEIRLVSERILDDPDVRSENVELVLEVLMNHGLPLGEGVRSPAFPIVGSPTLATSYWRIGRPDFRDFLSGVQVSEGIQISAAISESQTLFLLMKTTDRLVRIERHTAFGRRFADWRRNRFPAALGLRGVREFQVDIESSLRLFDILKLMRSSAYVFFLAGDLVSIPVQLLRSENGRIGSHAIVAVAPSRTWLDDCRHRANSDLVGLSAWVAGVAPLNTPLGGIGLLLDELGDEHGFRVSRGYIPPEKPHRLAIVGAHGVLGVRGLMSVADEEGSELPLPALADAIGNADVVLLLVCGGGLQGGESRSTDTLGLPFDLLRLGARAVVASHWNVDVSTMAEWLPTFLRLWSGGLSVGECVLAANKRLLASQRFKGIADAFAMTVFGNPDVCA